MTVTSPGTLLGGRVAHAQPVAGHRTGLEPVLLAAAIPARSGERVLEGGVGSGAGLLCLAARVPGLRAVGIERDPALATLARANAAVNGCAIEIAEADLLGWVADAPFDHAFANPPWHDPAGTRSAVAAKEAARRATKGGIAAWAAALAAALRPRGTLTLAFPPACIPECLAALPACGCGSACVFPLWPRAGTSPRLVLLRADKGGRGPFRLLAGLVLHAACGFTPEAEAVLREGAALPGLAA